MALETPKRVHVAALGIEYDRIVDPPTEHGADRVVLLEYLPANLRTHLERDDIETVLADNDIDCDVVDVQIEDLFDAVAAFGRVFDQYESDQVYVNLASGDKVTAIGGMIACMADGTVEPYYVEAEQHGSHQPPAPRGVRSIHTVPSYPIERPEYQHLAIMAHIGESDRTNAQGEPYRIKRELFEFGEEQSLAFMSDFEGDTDKGKFRRLDAHVVSPLAEKEYVDVKQVGTQRRVFLTEDGENTLRAFRYLLGDSAPDAAE